jgi:hypothetical protein
VVVFPRTWEETKDLWAQDRIVLVRGKAEKRGESVNVLCDTVQNYVTRATAADDGDPYAALRTAPVFVDGNGHGRPPVGRPALAAAPPRSAGLRVADAAEELIYGDDAGDAPDDGNPFALEEPEWLREAPAAWEGERVNGERLTVNGERLMVNGERLTVNGERLTVNGERLMVNGERLTVNGEPRPAREESLPVAAVPQVDH